MPRLINWAVQRIACSLIGSNTYIFAIVFEEIVEGPQELVHVQRVDGLLDVGDGYAEGLDDNIWEFGGHCCATIVRDHLLSKLENGRKECCLVCVLQNFHKSKLNALVHIIHGICFVYILELN